MAFKKYEMIANSKHRGYAALFFLFGAMVFIIPTLVITFKHVLKFNDLTNILLEQKQEKIAILTSVNKALELLSGNVSFITLLNVSVNPSSSSELLIHENSETIGDHTLYSKTYYMNYIISDDTVISDALNYPPSQKIVAAERHFLIVTTLYKADSPSHREETAVRIAPSGSIDEIWRREFVIY
jgi:hypothetical protein